MRKALLSLAALALLSAPAWAVTLSNGGKLVKIKDHSSLYDYSLTRGNGMRLEQNLGEKIDSKATTGTTGDEQRTIFQVTNIFNDAGNAEFDTSSPTELTGMLYDLQVLAVYQTPQGFVIDFGALGRNPLTANGAVDVDGDTTGVTYNGRPIAGGVIEVYEDSKKNYTANPGGVADYDDRLSIVSYTNGPFPMDPNNAPSKWDEGQMTNTRDAFPTISDGSLWLSAQLIDLQYLQSINVVADPTLIFGGVGFTDGTLLRETIDFSTGSGSGFGYANIFGGSYESNIDRSIGGARLVDLAMLFDLNTPIQLDLNGDGISDRAKDTLVYQGPGQWSVDSEDPIVFYVSVPEPCTLSVLGLSLVGLGVIRRRK